MLFRTRVLLLLASSAQLGCTAPPAASDGGQAAQDGDVSSADARLGSADAVLSLADAVLSSADARSAGEFSFFVTSLQTMREQSGSEHGFGGNLGGLTGADQICQTAAANVGFGDHTWRAFLSVTAGHDGQPINAIDRIGDGPWFDRNGRLVATGRDGLLGIRPNGDPATVNDLPDEYGVPLSVLGDAHDVVTGSDGLGRLYTGGLTATCSDWTSAEGDGTDWRVACGHSFPRGGEVGYSWSSDHTVPGCAPGVYLEQGPSPGYCIGCAGGYGAIYCFAE